jgi:lactate racemase
MAGAGKTTLTDDEISAKVTAGLARSDFDGKRVLVLIPDGTRTAPIPQMFRLLHRELGSRVTALDFLIALGTHQPMTPAQINALVGVEPHEWDTTFAGVHVYNHEWQKPETFITLGSISAEEVTAISRGNAPQSD